MVIACSSRRLPFWTGLTSPAVHLVHQYHIHPALSVSTLASNSSRESNPSKSIKSSSRLQQLNCHLSRTTSPLQTFNMSGYRTRKIGAPFTLEHRIYIEDSHGNVVSPFHDIPLYANEQQTVLNMVVEIPRWTNAKMEVSHVEGLIHIAPIAKRKLTRVARRSRKRNH